MRDAVCAREQSKQMVETAVFGIDNYNVLNGVESAARFLCQSACAACE